MPNTNNFCIEVLVEEPSAEEALRALLNVAMNCPHPRPFSPGRRELRFLFPLLGERARVRAAKDSNPKIILLFSNAALRHLLPKFIQGRSRYKVINFGSKSKLLKLLNQRLAAYSDRIKNGENLRVVVLVDRDNDDCQKLKNKLEASAKQAGLCTKSNPSTQGRFSVLNRIAIEELESWFIGDPGALRQAFSSLPDISPNKGIFRNSDNGGRWKALHRFLKKHGIYNCLWRSVHRQATIGGELGLCWPDLRALTRSG